MTVMAERPRRSIGSVSNVGVGSRGRLGWGLVDQVLTSGNAALLLFAVAHAAPVRQFGVFALCGLLQTTATATSRGLLGAPISLLAGHRETLKREFAKALSVAMALGIVVGTALWITAESMGERGWPVWLAIAAPVTLMQDVGRYHALACGRPKRACAADGAWLVVTIVLLALTWSGAAGVVDVSRWWAISAFMSATVLMATSSTAPSVRGVAPWLVDGFGRRASFGLESFLGVAASMMVIGVVTTFVGAAGSAALRGSAAVFGLMGIFLQAVPLAVVPEVRLRGLRDVRHVWSLMVRCALPLSVASLALGLVGAAVPDAWGELALGRTWSVTQPLLPVTGAEFALLAWLTAANGVERARGNARQVLENRLVFAGSALLLGCASAVVLQSALAVATALAIAAAIAATWARARLALDRSSALGDTLAEHLV